MTDPRQPHDSEGGALLWSVDGTLSVRRTASGYHVTMSNIENDCVSFDAHQDDIEAFIDQLKRLAGSY